MKTIDIAALEKVTGGVRPGENGQGCTGGTKRPRPMPRPQLPRLDGAAQPAAE